MKAVFKVKLLVVDRIPAAKQHKHLDRWLAGWHRMTKIFQTHFTHTPFHLSLNLMTCIVYIGLLVPWFQGKWKIIRCLDAKTWFITGLLMYCRTMCGNARTSQGAGNSRQCRASHLRRNTSKCGNTCLYHNQYPSVQGQEKGIIQGWSAGVAGPWEQTGGGNLTVKPLFSCLKQGLFAPRLLTRAVSFLPTRQA